MGESSSMEHAAEFLRLALPLMSKHGVPVTPPNYAIWYEHVSGENPDLSCAIEAIIAHDQPFSEEVCSDLYRRFVSQCDVTQFQEIRADMAGIVNEVHEDISVAARNSENYGGTLDTVARDLQNSTSLNEIRSMLHSLVTETREMRENTESLRQNFNQKSDEIRVLQQRLDEERKRASVDPLTGLPNRAALFDALTDASENPDDRPVSLLMVDIDHFKQFNDKFGHLIGDRILRYVATELRKMTRGSDTAARFGGEEFAIVLPGTGPEGAKAVANNIRRRIEETKLVRSETKESLGQVTVSIGVGIHRNEEDIMELIDRSDRALYLSKQKGRNRVTLESELN